VFTVDRGPFGTEVGVERGVVQVICTRAGEYRLEAGAIAVCTEDAPSALALAMQEEQQPQKVLAAVTAGLAHPEISAQVRSELQSLGVDALLAQGKVEEAMAQAPGLDPSRPTQRATLHRLVLAAPSCEQARPALLRLAPTDAGAAIRLAACAPSRGEALRILEAAREVATEEERAGLEAWIERTREAP
jgi:hypothetical protein